MTAITFPSSPTVGQYYTSDTKTWQWDGKRWMPTTIIITGTLQSNTVSSSSLQSNLTLTGNTIMGNVTHNGVTNLGPIGNVKITGGTNGQLVSTDGTGNLSFINAPSSFNAGKAFTFNLFFGG